MQINIKDLKKHDHPYSFCLNITGWFAGMDSENDTDHYYSNTIKSRKEFISAYSAISKFNDLHRYPDPIEHLEDLEKSEVFSDKEKDIINKLMPTSGDFYPSSFIFSIRYYDEEGLEREIEIVKE